MPPRRPPSAAARIPIDPKVDVVFIRLFSDPAHKGVCIAFLNAVLPLAAPVVDIEVQTPFVLAHWLRHKRPVVDVLARDQRGAIFQIELQRQREPALASRMVYSLCRLVGNQLKKGEPYSKLRPVWSIWILEEPLGPEWSEGRTLFQLRSEPRGHERARSLSDGVHLVLLQLHRPLRVEEAHLEPWFLFFRSAQTWSEVPVEARIPPILEAWEMLQQFSASERARRNYERRLDAERVELGRQEAMQEAQEAMQEAQEALAQERAAREHAERAHAEAEAARLLERERAERELSALREKLRLAGLS